ncbi:unnamed protein product [Phyllotreta striolata]|uniref:Uncharacterized protein n=1 Tax=Phyllotreta striolata TaxID=444603 RepID=A0A9N9XKC0_PHYSR|nr:unnamed protein product [Phyllotreta striolata]
MMMFEVGNIGGTKMDAAAALKQTPHIRQPYSVKNQMMRFLRRSKSAANAPSEKITPKHVPNEHLYRRNHVHPQTRVVNHVEGLPIVVANKPKKILLESVFAEPALVNNSGQLILPLLVKFGPVSLP